MKKIFFPFFFLTLIGYAGCVESEVNSFAPEESSINPVTNNGTIEEAAEIANQLLVNGIVTTRSNAKIALNAKPHIISSNISRSHNADTLIYAFDLEDENGFILIAAPKNVEPIMAIVETGSFEDVNNNDNPAFQTTFNLITNYVYELSKDDDGFNWGINPQEPLKPHISMSIIRNREPSVDVAWSQRWPECLYTPNWLAGCVPVSIGMALSAFEKPSEITYTFEGRDLDREKLDWHEIKRHKQSSGAYSGCETCSVSNDSTHNTIGRLIRQIGELVGTMYSKHPTSSNTVTGKGVEEAIKELAGLTPDDHRGARRNTIPGTIDSLYNRLSNNAGVAIVDYGLAEDLSMGHAFIADATQLVVYVDTGLPYINKTEVKMIHYNWGAAGMDDGWYYLDAVNPDNAFSYDYPDLESENEEYSVNSLIYWFYKL